jgi:hypothetical protein
MHTHLGLAAQPAGLDLFSGHAGPAQGLIVRSLARLDIMAVVRTGTRQAGRCGARDGVDSSRRKRNADATGIGLNQPYDVMFEPMDEGSQGRFWDNLIKSKCASIRSLADCARPSKA